MLLENDRVCPAACSRDLPRGALVFDLQIDLTMGHGPRGTTYKALRPGEAVVLKLSRFEASIEEREMQYRLLAAEIPGVGPIVDVDVHRGRLYQVRELLYGEPIGAWLRRPTRVNATELGVAISQLGRALERLHDERVVVGRVSDTNAFVVRSAGAQPVRAVWLDVGMPSAMELPFDVARSRDILDFAELGLAVVNRAASPNHAGTANALEPRQWALLFALGRALVPARRGVYQTAGELARAIDEAVSNDGASGDDGRAGRSVLKRWLARLAA